MKKVYRIIPQTRRPLIQDYLGYLGQKDTMLFSTILSISLRIQIDILVQERLVFAIIR